MLFRLSTLSDEPLPLEFENIVLLLRNCHYFRNVYGKCSGSIATNGKNCILRTSSMTLSSATQISLFLKAII